jgi:iron complex outermembrane receptor protein
VTFTPEERTYDRIGAFAQYELDISAYRLKLIAGSKIEKNTFTGWDVQPTGRFIWNPAAGHTVWGAVSRAVRVPSRAETDIALRFAVIPPLTPRNPTPLPVEVRGFGTADPESEKLTAYELGYRAELTRTFAVDFAAYYNRYSQLSELIPGGAPTLQPTPPPHLLAPVFNMQPMEAETYGFELSGDWLLTEEYRLRGAWSAYGSDFHRSVVPSVTGSMSSRDGSYPRQQFSVSLAATPLPDVTADVTLRSVGRVADGGGISAYVTADLRLGWKITPEIELSAVGRNLFDPTHPEFVSEYLGTQSTEVPRSAFVQIVWRQP